MNLQPQLQSSGGPTRAAHRNFRKQLARSQLADMVRVLLLPLVLSVSGESGKCAWESASPPSPPALCINVDDSCSMHTEDAMCDDGGPGSMFSLCAIGTDCVDCNLRGARRLQVPAETQRDLRWFTNWLSPAKISQLNVTNKRRLEEYEKGSTCNLFAIHSGSCGVFQKETDCWGKLPEFSFLFDDDKICCSDNDGDDCCDPDGAAIGGVITGIVVLITLIIGAIIACSMLLQCCACCPCNKHRKRQQQARGGGGTAMTPTVTVAAASTTSTSDVPIAVPVAPPV